MREAIANWKQEERRALVDAAAAKTVADMDRIVLRLDAAVCDCMLAAVDGLPHDLDVGICDEETCSTCRRKAEIKRQFGLPGGQRRERRMTPKSVDCPICHMGGWLVTVYQWPLRLPAVDCPQCNCVSYLPHPLAWCGMALARLGFLGTVHFKGGSDDG